MSKIYLPSLYTMNGFKFFSLLYFLFIMLIFSSCLATLGVTEPSPSTSRSSKTLAKKRSLVVEDARTLLGTKYKYGGKTPTGFDCSGFTYYVMKKHNILLNASSQSQSYQGELVKLKDLKAGDLIFFGKPKNITHVGIVTKNDKSGLTMIHSSSSRGIIEESVTNSVYWNKRIVKGSRVLN